IACANIGINPYTGKKISQKEANKFKYAAWAGTLTEVGNVVLGSYYGNKAASRLNGTDSIKKGSGYTKGILKGNKVGKNYTLDKNKNVGNVTYKKSSGAKIPDVDIKNPLSKKNQSHINKHNVDSFKNQAQYLSESQLAEKLDGNSFFNPNWTKDQINKYTEIAYNDLLSQGKKGNTFLYKINGEEISIYIQPDGGFGTAYGKYQYTLDQFKNFMK
ncbi:hypothetical protein HRE96_14210, partial [Enterococcus faecalis]|nr:hypothetical protein [Enterococcus faecalis]